MEIAQWIIGSFGTVMVCAVVAVFWLHLLPSRRRLALTIGAMTPLTVFIAVVVSNYIGPEGHEMGLEIIALPIMGFPLLFLSCLGAALAARIVKKR